MEAVDAVTGSLAGLGGVGRPAFVGSGAPTREAPPSSTSFGIFTDRIDLFLLFGLLDRLVALDILLIQFLRLDGRLGLLQLLARLLLGLRMSGAGQGRLKIG
jgi:hypothetical protein